MNNLTTAVKPINQECRFVFKEIVHRTVFWKDGGQKSDELYALMECIDCKKIRLDFLIPN